MKHLFPTITLLVVVGCAHVQKEGSGPESRLVGVYEGREVIDTEEIITLRKDHSFTYDFIPFGRDGAASYEGQWKVDGADVILIAARKTGGEEQFRLTLTYQGEKPRLTYSWNALGRQRATMLIPNVFVWSKKEPEYRAVSPREKLPNQTAEPTRTTVTPPADAGDRASGARGSP